MKTSASRPRAAISAAARSARSRATSIRPPVPEIGLMMTAIVEATTSWTSPRRTFGVTNQFSAPARRDVRLSTSIRQTPPFLKVSARPAPMRCAASSPRPGSWPTSAMPAAPGRAGELRQDRAGRMSGRERVEHLDRWVCRAGRPARISAVCLARTSGLVKISSTATSSRDNPLTDSLNRATPRAVSGRLSSSGQSSPRSAAMAWRTR